MGIEQGSGKVGEPSRKDRLEEKIAELRGLDEKKAKRVTDAKEKFIDTDPSVETAEATEELVNAYLEAREQSIDDKWFKALEKHPASTRELLADALEEKGKLYKGSLAGKNTEKQPPQSSSSLEDLLISGNAVEEVNARIDEFNILRNTKHQQLDEALVDILELNPTEAMEEAIKKALRAAVDTGKAEADIHWLGALKDNKYISEHTWTEVWDDKDRRSEIDKTEG